MKGKIKLMAILLGTLLVLQTPFLARAFTEPTWNYDIPDEGGGADATGGGQPCNELLEVHIAWDNTYIYVRWDVKATLAQIWQVYYVLSIDAVAPFDTPVATRLLQFEASQTGAITVTIRDASDPRTILWPGSAYDFTWTEITDGIGLIGRYPWSAVTGDGPAVVWIIRAESHASDPDQGINSAVKDSIAIPTNPIPWFTDLTMTVLITTVLVAFYVKKRGALAVKLKA